MESQKLEGIVKFYNSEKGYGFIIHEEKDIFVHAEHLMNCKTIYRHQKVKFNLITLTKGPMAIEVEPCE
jgi:cold shock CspA family protein